MPRGCFGPDGFNISASIDPLDFTIIRSTTRVAIETGGRSFGPPIQRWASRTCFGIEACVIHSPQKHCDRPSVVCEGIRHFYYGDVRVGHVGTRSGVPKDVDQLGCASSPADRARCAAVRASSPWNTSAMDRRKKSSATVASQSIFQNLIRQRPASCAGSTPATQNCFSFDRM